MAATDAAKRFEEGKADARARQIRREKLIVSGIFFAGAALILAILFLWG